VETRDTGNNQETAESEDGGMDPAGGTAVAQSVLQTVKTIDYHYPAPVREVVTQLRLFPRPRRGPQRLLSRKCEVWPRPDRTRRFRDEFGNEVWEFLHRTVAERLQFAVRFTTEHAWKDGSGRSAAARLRASQGIPTMGMTAFLRITSLVDESEEIREAAQSLARAKAAPAERMEAIGRWVHQVMQFCGGVTNIHTPASVALAGRQGVCQDYAHVMLAICRATGIPCRYVSGFIPGEGYMHAWVEALVADSRTGTAHWEGFDPTHNRRPDAHYLAVAAGRDYADVTPVTGTFYGSEPGSVAAWSKTALRDPLASLGTPAGAAVT
jgi:transglutaminase-like putative cysteine protease